MGPKLINGTRLGRFRSCDLVSSMSTPSAWSWLINTARVVGGTCGPPRRGGVGGCDLLLCLCAGRSHQAQLEFLYNGHFASRRAGRATRVLLDIDALPEDLSQPHRRGPAAGAGAMFWVRTARLSLIAGMGSAVGLWCAWKPGGSSLLAHALGEQGSNRRLV